MVKIDSLLQGAELSTQEVDIPNTPQKNTGNKKLIACIAFCAIAGSALMIHNMNDNTVTKVDGNNSVLSSIKNNISSTVAKVGNKVQTLTETRFPIYEQSNLVNANNKDNLNKVGDFNLPEKLADNQVARKVSQIQFSTGNDFLSLVSEGEGFRSHAYNDNIGFAIGNGWNMSMQSKAYNENLAKAVSKNSEFVYKVTVLAGKTSDKSISADYNSVTIAPQRAMQVAAIMGEKFEPGVINGIAKQMPKNSTAIKIHKDTNKSYEQISKEMYNNLAPNEKAAVLYHSYKVGEAGFAKYTGMIGSLINYGLSENKTEAMKKEVADKFTYKYKMNGQILEDTRASVLVGTMFASQEAFGYLIGKNVAPHNISNLTTALKTNNVDGQAAPGEVQIADPVGVERAKLEASGGKIQIEIVPTNNVNSQIELMRDKAKVPRTHLPMGYMG